ncbi:hypothetical protein C8J56DRAFT_1033331 [Mycena floridula]|nr:hypothetical protein C8J56DRAFT_1033331 [Mycena floridula]
MSKSRSLTPKPDSNLTTSPSTSTCIPEPSTLHLNHSPKPSCPDSIPDSPPMAKRMRRESPRPCSRSSPFTDDSQGDLADTEEGTRSQGLSESPAPSFPQKKRTRTLTTPHQSAVLHALLAQSRFPTTAMREEVGRAIGLSARKVQVCSQNQRQKARRPQSGPPSIDVGPPQYGVFPHQSPFAWANPRSPYAPRSGFVTEPRLLGPGIPGRSEMRFSSHRSIRSSNVWDSERHRSESPPWSARATIHHDTTRTLPPLVFHPNGDIPPRSAPAAMAPLRYPYGSPQSISLSPLSSSDSLRPLDNSDSSSPTSEDFIEEPVEPKARSGRYDPVRGVVVPFQTSNSPLCSD